ncbi:hypothetical protein NE237_003886 [Protea cynaroides]|uniref:Uncharacterized protein n=1 Tax=Protea cynaroides TaxID=273540 RepID=A0A9Q0KHV0_9MAGN|nr:hypothetical protein NE237_003886 [Protea cynaroides]
MAPVNRITYAFPYSSPPPPPPGNDTTIIIVVFVSFGGLFFLACLSVALCCCFMKKKKKKKIIEETEIVNVDEHSKVHEAILPGPHGTEAVVLCVEEDLHIEEIKEEKVDDEGSHSHLHSHIRSSTTDGDGEISPSVAVDEVGPSSSQSSSTDQSHLRQKL